MVQGAILAATIGAKCGPPLVEALRLLRIQVW